MMGFLKSFSLSLSLSLSRSFGLFVLLLREAGANNTGVLRVPTDGRTDRPTDDGEHHRRLDSIELVWNLHPEGSVSYRSSRWRRRREV